MSDIHVAVISISLIPYNIAHACITLCNAVVVEWSSNQHDQEVTIILHQDFTFTTKSTCSGQVSSTMCKLPN